MRADPVEFMEAQEPRYQRAAATLIGCFLRLRANPESAVLRLSVGWGADLDPTERAAVAAALWRELEMFPPHPRLVASARAEVAA